MSKFIQEQKMPGVWNLNRLVKENMVSATRSPSEMLGVLPLNWEGRNVSCKGHWVGSDPPVTSIWGPCQALPLHALNVPWFLWLQSQEKFADQRHTEDKRGYDLAHVNSWEKNWVKREAKSPHHPWSPSWPFSVSQGCCPCSWVPQPVLWRQKLEGGHQGATPSGSLRPLLWLFMRIPRPGPAHLQTAHLCITFEIGAAFVISSLTTTPYFCMCDLEIGDSLIYQPNITGDT